MRAAVISSDRQLVLSDAPDPVPTPGQVLLEVAYCGICGSDLGSINNLARYGEGYIMGHEVVGQVLDPGREAEWSVGDRVAVYHAVGCETCVMCQSGRSYRCLRALETSIGHGVVPGGYAERIAVPGRILTRLPDGVSFRLGALAEPLGIALHGIHVGGVAASEAVCILGGGPIGALTARALTLQGNASTVVVEPNEHRAGRLNQLGITALGLDDAVEKVTAALGTEPAVVFECSGNKDAAALAIELVAPFGRVVLQGRPHAPSPIPQSLVGRKELQIIGSASCTQEEFTASVAHLDANGPSYEELVGSVFGLDSAQAAFEQLRRPDNVHVKILIGPGS